MNRRRFHAHRRGMTAVELAVTFAVVEYLSHRFVKGGESITMDCTHDPTPKGKTRTLPHAIVTSTEGGQL